ncbi:LOW QUALITY PROTEIN: putative DBH-like monooxygenase protein 2 [Phaethornis superciliosus]
MMFELQVTTGWVAFGFSPHGELPGSDIVIGGVFPNGSIYFSDFHVVDEASLEEDESQDYQLLSVTENATSTTMLFKCHLRTCDPSDLDITFAVPVEKTATVKQKHHIYKFEPVITPHNITLVHHILVYACGNASLLASGTDDCYGAKPDFALCSQVLVGWAVGGEAYQFPDEAAISIGTPWDPQYVRLEIHYSNFDLLPGLKHSAKLCLPGSDLFHFELQMNGMLVPDLHVFGYLLHTHLSGRGVKVVQYPNSEHLGVICEDSKYDFTLQEIREVKELMIIKAGDEILVECNFQTLDRSEITFGGPSTMNEMCLAFLFYCPRNNISSCMGYPDILYIAHVLNQEASDPVEGMMAINFVDDNETAKIAEKAAKEADQVVMIKTIDGGFTVKGDNDPEEDLDPPFMCYHPTTSSPPDSKTLSTSYEEALSCPQGWEKNGRKCYFFFPIQEEKNWNDSRKECTAKGSDLVIIDNEEELAYLKSRSIGYYYLLGLTYSKSKEKWKWINDMEHNTDMFKIKSKYPDYFCTVIGYREVTATSCDGASTTRIMCEKAAVSEGQKES